MSNNYQDTLKMFLAMYAPNSGEPSDDPKIDIPRRVFEHDLDLLITEAIHDYIKRIEIK